MGLPGGHSAWLIEAELFAAKCLLRLSLDTPAPRQNEAVLHSTAEYRPRVSTGVARDGPRVSGGLWRHRDAA